MNLLADENIERPIVDFLRAQGHDVLYACESFASTPDPDILSRANAEERIILTADLDFGELVFHRKLASAGIVLIRLKTTSLDEKLQLFKNHWQAAAAQAIGNFVVMTPQRLRVRRLS